jgi:signal transduction histidine kinase
LHKGGAVTDEDLPPTKILAVDDREENLIALEALLRRDDLEILLAHSGDEALELLLVHDVALALLDVQMPEMDGFMLAELMRGSERTRHVPIIFITAGSNDRSRAFRGYDAGAVDFLFKPIDTRILRHKTDTFVQLYRQRQKLAMRLKLNETFIASVGHDLRTPLNVIMMSAGMIRDDTNEPATRRAAERMVSSGRRMSNMIDDLFDLARVRLGTGLSIVRQRMDFALVVRRVITEFETTDPGRVIEFTQDGNTSGEWDEMRCEQFVANLVANAIGHGAKDQPVIIDLVGGRDDLTLTIKNGGAISPEELPHVFDPFRTAKGSRSRSRGLGLGLYIIQQIVLAHEGEIEVKSSTEEGTSVRVRLPRLL